MSYAPGSLAEAGMDPERGLPPEAGTLGAPPEVGAFSGQGLPPEAELPPVPGAGGVPPEVGMSSGQGLPPEAELPPVPEAGMPGAVASGAGDSVPGGAGPGEQGAGGAGAAGEAKGADEGPRASRVTTALLAVALVLVVVVTGVLGTVAVLMTTNPDSLPGAARPTRLAVPIWFAPVTGTQPAPCPGVEAILDEAGTTCYLVARGVKVTAVHKVETVRDQNGGYAVRVALPDPFGEQVRTLTQEEVRQQIVIAAGTKVVAAPTVEQAITQDSLSISGSFTKERADALVAQLLGGAVTGVGTPGPGTAPPTCAPPGPCPTTSATVGDPPVGQPSGQQPPAGQPTAGAPTAGTSTPPPGTGGTGGTGAPSGPVTTGAPQAGTTRSPVTGVVGNPQPGTDDTDPLYDTCAQANAAGYGPYYKETHPEYAHYGDPDNDGVACEPT
ncbi:excalibur calcium-binding domain-containing protein [Microtetraspora sp. NBRC 13810]|uniref:excalibur calcium-binding domain-containing protein n=1 Tax=Microtetraspora sp. NBRC 13810 TaxID=3030990 RepID=UPI0025543716|nr:excalibur calcium-binding domain-containing protein [Microtetraspora sp. NBRC 13810]